MFAECVASYTLFNVCLGAWKKKLSLLNVYQRPLRVWRVSTTRLATISCSPEFFWPRCSINELIVELWRPSRICLSTLYLKRVEEIGTKDKFFFLQFSFTPTVGGVWLLGSLKWVCWIVYTLLRIFIVASAVYIVIWQMILTFVCNYTCRIKKTCCVCQCVIVSCKEGSLCYILRYFSVYFNGWS